MRKKSRTRKDTNFIDRMFGMHHYKTTISKGDKYVHGYGNSSESSQRRASRNSRGSSGGDSCCYLVTACLDNLGIPRETSRELKAMKLVTKEHILSSRQGRRDYLLYHRKAPGIVSKIEARSDSREIFGGVYERLQGIAQTIFGGDLESGYQDYKSLVTELDASL